MRRLQRSRLHTHISAQVLSSSSPNSSQFSYFDWIDSCWSSSWIAPSDSVRAAVISPQLATSAEELGFLPSALIYASSSCALDPSCVLLLFGFLMRLPTLVLSLYGERAASRMEQLAPQLSIDLRAFHSVYYNQYSKKIEIQLASETFKHKRRELYSKHSTSNVKCFSSLLGVPIIFAGFHAASLVCANRFVGFGSSSVLWLTLGSTDPFFLTPIVSCLLTLANFELTLRSRASTMSSPWTSSVLSLARFSAVAFVPLVSSFHSGLLLCWIGMSVAGLLQPALLRSLRFRRVMNFPNDASSHGHHSNTNQLQEGEGSTTSGAIQKLFSLDTRRKVLKNVFENPIETLQPTKNPTGDVLALRFTSVFPFLARIVTPDDADDAVTSVRRTAVVRGDRSTPSPIKTTSWNAKGAEDPIPTLDEMTRKMVKQHISGKGK